MNWSLMGLGAVAAFVCGFMGFLSAGFTISDSVYGALHLFIMEHPDVERVGILLNIARFLAPLLLAITAIRTFALLLKDQIQDWKLGRLKGHVVICGLGRKGYELAKQYKGERKVVIIDKDKDNGFIDSSRDRDTHILTGDITDPAVLGKARTGFASDVYLMTGSDGANFSALTHIAKINEAASLPDEKQKVWLHLSSVEMCSFLRDEKILERVRKTVDFEIVSLFEAAARDLVVNELIPLLPVRPDDTRRLHLVQIGMGRMGRTIIRKLTQCAVTANGKLPKVTIVSKSAAHDHERLEGDLPGIGRFCELNMFEGDILYRSIQGQIVETIKNALSAGEIPVICLAVDSQHTNISAAMFLADQLAIEKLEDIPLFVRLTESEGWAALADDLSEQREGAYRFIKGFGIISNLCNLKEIQLTKLNNMAKVLHKNYLTERKKDGTYDASKQSHQPWETLGWHYRASNQQAADHLRVKLRTIGLELVDAKTATEEDVGFNPNDGESSILTQLEHRRWMVEKELLQWKPGIQTDLENKVHSSLVKWDRLSETEKKKDEQQIKAYQDAIAAGEYKVIREGAHQ